MKTEVKVKEIFVHGKDRYEPGSKQNPSFTQGDARDLEKAGLVEIIGEAQPDQETKMEAEPENKMAEAPANKSRQQKGK